MTGTSAHTIGTSRFPAVILAGGRSSRMGANKALVPFGRQPLLDHIIDRLRLQVSAIVINAVPGWAEDRGFPVVPDSLPDQPGPLAGVLAGLRHARSAYPDVTHLLSVPADSPFFPADLAARLSQVLDDTDTIAIAASDGREHPVFGLWPVSIADDLAAWLAQEENRRVRSFLARHRLREVLFPLIDTPHGPLDPFFNINTPDDLSRARLFLETLEE
ncbi:molybdenum cofactor guanylyltransferase MobA [Rhizobiaceae bacterium n13]|uniref:Molybdenum cofactor guanylyltransferase n=1 Tax=Ferirhizobium litorale TaxID=2927786 RepID=A0AAE3QJG0_9HYPH|nr:molybdenum cofactor guanylyltransferase MobA [Fererhizobium litorale]MDI7863849.1 molybdenum cofactor guanylyltransferase MobA [Fererhizobium litorale]MDI7924319.1 molybdenum cofactor guanylyltransferase MobA [Fererhizobium litorale]